MKVLHLSAGNRWTGAAAPAFAEVEALRGAGIEAHYGYVGGYKLETKIGHLPYAHPIIERRQNPGSFLRTARAIRALVEHHSIDVVHEHLTYDHWLSRLAVRGSNVRIARTFHARRVLRGDPFTHALVRSTQHLFVINETFITAGVLRGREVTFTPPPVDHRVFHPGGINARAAYSVDPVAPLLCAIGKLAPDRGFEEALRTFAMVREVMPAARLLVIGHGPHQPSLEALARDLGVGEAMIWAGYHEDDLPEHFRAADVLLFLAKGSDEGHRAILEAMACGTPAVSMPIEGVDALFRGLPPRFIAAEPGVAALADRALDILSTRSDRQRAEVAKATEPFGLAAAAGRLLRAYR